MRRIAAIAFALLALLAGPARAEAPSSPALWRMETGGEPVYLFGSFHLLPPGTKWRSAAFDNAFAKAEIAVFEIPTDAAAEAEIQALVIARGLNAAGTPLSKTIAPEAWTEVAEFAQTLGLPPEALEPMRPWYAALLLTVQHMISLGFDPSQGVDATLAPEARAAGKTLAFLETPEEQITIFSGLAPALQEQLLVESVRELKAAGNSADEMANAWLAGDTERLATLVNGSMDRFPELQDRLMFARNRAWVGKIEAMADGRHGVMVVVGAGHLVGPESVVALLRARGHAISGP